MALRIVDSCVACHACLDVCPNRAIAFDAPIFSIDADRCSECLGDFAVAQCAAICPVEGAIIDELGEALNPLGSLTGIPPARLAERLRGAA